MRRRNARKERGVFPLGTPPYVAPFAGHTPKPIIAVGEPWMSLVPHLEAALTTTPRLVSIAPDVDTAVAELVARLAI